MCQTLLLSVVALAAWAAAPVALGWAPTTVISGSMLPRLFVGDVAVSRPLGNRPPAIDQVLLFHDPDHPGRLRLHRLVDVTDHGQLVTRGDANLADDSTPVDLAAVQGVAVLRVPFVGLPIVWMREGRRVWLGAASLALLLLAAGSRLAPRTDTISEPHTIPEPPATPRQHRGWRRFARISVLALALSVLVIGVGTAIAVPAAAGFATTTSNPQSSWSGAAFWKCRSAVLADSPFLYYPLDEINGTTAVDASRNGRDGTFQGTVTKRRQQRLHPRHRDRRHAERDRRLHLDLQPGRRTQHVQPADLVQDDHHPGGLADRVRGVPDRPLDERRPADLPGQ